jgi:hypothetical protein
MSSSSDDDTDDDSIIHSRSYQKTVHQAAALAIVVANAFNTGNIPKKQKKTIDNQPTKDDSSTMKHVWMLLKEIISHLMLYLVKSLFIFSG